MSKIFYDFAKKNFPKFWNRAMIDNLYALGRLSDEEYREIIGGEEETAEDEIQGKDHNRII